MGPGPSPAHPRVREAMSLPIVGHLDLWFSEMLDGLSEKLRATFLTSNRLTFTVSGTGSAGMETSIDNLIEPGDEAIVCINGAFGERLHEMCMRAGASVTRVEAAWGEIVEPALVEEAVRAHPNAALVAIVQAETSTGVLQPIEPIASVLDGTDCLLVVDCVTSLAGSELRVDEWAIDVAYSGTQKCLSVPPGLSPITLSAKAERTIESRKSKPNSWYLDVALIREYWGTDRVYHHTAPISMLYALDAGLDMVLEEGLPSRWARHQEVGARLQQELITRGFTLFAAESYRLPQLTSFLLPDDAEDGKLRSLLLDRFGIEVGGGLGRFKGRMWRVGTMGEGARHENVDRFLEAIDEIF